MESKAKRGRKKGKYCGRVYRPGVFIAVYRKSAEANKDKIEYLLLKRKLHWKGWEFPKGGCMLGERERKSVVRELKEETGLKPLHIRKYNKKGKYKYSRKLADREGFIGQTYALYSAEVEGGKIKIDRKEHSAYKWADFDRAVRMLRWNNQKGCLKIVAENIRTPKGYKSTLK